MEDSTEELDELDPSTYVTRAMTLVERIKTVAGSEGTAAAWLATWAPVGSAILRLGHTFSKLALRLRNFDDGEELFSVELREEFAEDLHDIGETFPDVADVLFGLPHLDRVAHAVTHDEEARTIATTLLRLAERALDRAIDNVVDLTLGQRESSVGPDDVLAFLRRYEELAQRVLDRMLETPTQANGES